jgi:hypothetical protein
MERYAPKCRGVPHEIPASVSSCTESSAQQPACPACPAGWPARAPRQLAGERHERTTPSASAIQRSPGQAVPWATPEDTHLAHTPQGRSRSRGDRGARRCPQRRSGAAAPRGTSVRVPPGQPGLSGAMEPLPCRSEQSLPRGRRCVSPAAPAPQRARGAIPASGDQSPRNVPHQAVSPAQRHRPQPAPPLRSHG